MKKIYLILFFITILSFSSKIYAKDSKNEYFRENIVSYFSGTISFNNNNTKKAYEYLEKIENIKNNHTNYNIKYIHTLVLLKKFKQAFAFSKNLQKIDNTFFEADLLLGLEAFIEKDYINAQKYFARFNEPSQYNSIYINLLKSILLSWTHAAQNNKEKSFYYYNKINNQYYVLKKIQNTFLECYFDTPKVEESFQQLINDKNYIFSRYNFFLGNYLLHKNKKKKAKEIIYNSSKTYNSNVLLKQTKQFILDEDFKKITKVFDCSKPEENIAEIFYVLANLSSSQDEYQISNFYLNISLFLNNKFKPNKALLAENFFYQKKFEDSKKIFNEVKSIGSIYSWYVAKSIASIISNIENVESSVLSLKKEFELLISPNFQNYYEMANFYNDNKYYEKAIEHYSIALKKIDKSNSLIPIILYRRGTCYERINNWKKAEEDLEKSLEIKPNQAFVLNYLAYTWTEKKININAALEMLNRATELEEDNGYILDSLGWAHYANKDYINAEYFLRKAVELMPSESVISDHYADTLWQLNKPIQARYFWKQVLDLKNIEQDLKENIDKKLVFGLKNNY
jgi:tetratricopeptide (TPR) repeat protein